MNKLFIATTCFALLGACTRTSVEQGEQGEQPSAEPSAKPAVPSAISLRSQFDLAAAIRVIEHEQDDEDRAFSLAQLTESWEGERYQWTVGFLSAFCPNAQGCHVVPFDRGGKDNQIVQGWSPQLELTDAQWERLAGACAKGSEQCRVTFSGTLSEFRISTEELTRLTFSEVSLEAVTTEISI